jgi:4-carboxymuconolactone decarboxylase
MKGKPLKNRTAAAAVFLLIVAGCNRMDQKPITKGPDAPPQVSLREHVPMVSPALERYTQDRLMGDLWKRSDLSLRDRSIVTLAALIARNQTGEMPFYLNLALDNGVKPSEISEIITHLAFYSGWGNAMSAIAPTKRVFTDRKIGTDQLAVS